MRKEGRKVEENVWLEHSQEGEREKGNRKKIERKVYMFWSTAVKEKRRESMEGRGAMGGNGRGGVKARRGGKGRDFNGKYVCSGREGD